MSENGAEDTDDVDVTVSIESAHTVIEVTGERDVAIVVRSDAGEQIYLPPEDFEDAPDRGTPYESGGGPGESDTAYAAIDATTPYQSAEEPSQSPYDGVSEPETTGLHSTPTGVRIVHPEPVDDLRLLR